MSPEFGKTLSSERPDGRAPIPPRRHDAAPGPAFSLTSPGLTLARDVEELVRPALRQAVETLPDPVRQVAEYHFGWSRGSAAAGGKSLRPSLALAGARAAGGDARQAVAGAVAVELVHNFSLLHDDVIDDDRTRRHRPAAWVRFGVGRAVLAGDALWALALEVLAETGEPAAIEVMIRTLADLMRGQSQDVAFESRDSITVEEYRAMAEGKTGALLGAACAVGALLGGASARQAEELDRFGRHLGVAFQCADDLLGIWGRADRTGKPVGNDLAARKKTLPVLAALARPGEPGDWLAEVYRRDDPPTAEEIVLMGDVIERAGGRQAAEREAESQIDAALACVQRAGPMSAAARAEFALLASWAARRDR